ncbi:hypothetical protein FOA43_003163 [Brettanomyces nanus]|uniref:Uncharacterized protein n=1 Tax=Eeniella nana TaxID=13502 RepID=A0A875S247_EENNA|nr:uncharacterized protein FOA43_003163 [Brettanomyces nanus]QPG75801.1 hypothetical protein FOA43_003163 [Brettanomyces nanus]
MSQRKHHLQRIHALQERYISSSNLLGKVTRLESKSPKTATDYKNIEKLNGKYKLLLKYEQDHSKLSEATSDFSSEAPKLLKHHSIYYDAELNPLGKAPFSGLPNFASYKVKQSTIPSNTDEPIPLPSTPKPRFYKLKQVQTTYVSKSYNE